MTELVGRVGDYVTYREHISAKEQADKRMAALELQFATLQTALMGVPGKLDKLNEAVAALHKSRAGDGSESLALHHAADALTKAVREISQISQRPSPVTEIAQLLRASDKTGGGSKMWTLVGSLATVAALLAWQVLFHAG